ALKAFQTRIDERTEASDLDGVLAVINEAMNAWPGEPVLLEQNDKFVAMKHERERQQGIQAAFGQARPLMSEQQFEKAAAVIDKAIASYGGGAALTALADENTRAWVERDHREEVRKLADQSHNCISEGRPEEALAILNDGLLKYPNESALTAI